MPIVISRATGEVLSAPEISQEQRDQLWGTVVKNYIRKHPEIFKEDTANE